MDWISAHLGLSWTIAGVSIVVTVLGVLAIPLLVVLIPADYFAERDPPAGRRYERPALHYAWLILKNLAGLVLLVLGVLMLFAPGPGLLAILLALPLLNFPGKRALELRIIRTPKILHAINSARAKAHRPPLKVFRG